jgi:8-amino-7-oxononanoate synthase
MLNFSSHDYLGLSQHAELKKNAIKALLHYGTGLCFGEAKESYVEYQRQIEEKCIQLLNMPELRFFSSKWVALAILLSSLQSESSVCFVDTHSDPLLHLAAKTWQRVVVYDSEDLDGLCKLLEKESVKGGLKLILAESLLSLNGKFCDVDSLNLLVKRYQGLLLVDDSNAFGVHGNGGSCVQNDSIDFLLCSLDRGGGIAGAFLASHLNLNLVFKTFSIDPREWSISYASLGAIDLSFDLLASMEGERKQLQQRCHWLRMQFKQLKLDVSSTSHFFCFAFSEKKQAESLWHALLQKEILAELIDASCCVKNRYMVRLIINSSHTPEDLTALISFFETWELESKNYTNYQK